MSVLLWIRPMTLHIGAIVGYPDSSDNGFYVGVNFVPGLNQYQLVTGIWGGK